MKMNKELVLEIITAVVLKKDLFIDLIHLKIITTGLRLEH